MWVSTLFCHNHTFLIHFVRFVNDIWHIYLFEAVRGQLSTLLERLGGKRYIITL
jgi:hypothetical protein